MEKTINFNDLMYNENSLVAVSESDLLNEEGTVNASTKQLLQNIWTSQNGQWDTKNPITLITTSVKNLWETAKAIGSVMIRPIETIIKRIKGAAEAGKGWAVTLTKVGGFVKEKLTSAKERIALLGAAIWNVAVLKYIIIGCVIFTTLMVVFNWWEKRESRLQARAEEEAKAQGKTVGEVSLTIEEINKIFSEGIDEMDTELSEMLIEDQNPKSVWGSFKSWVNRAWDGIKNFYQTKIKPNAGKILKALAITLTALGGWVVGGWIVSNVQKMEVSMFQWLKNAPGNMWTYLRDNIQKFNIFSKEEIINNKSEDAKIPAPVAKGIQEAGNQGVIDMMNGKVPSFLPNDNSLTITNLVNKEGLQTLINDYRSKTPIIKLNNGPTVGKAMDKALADEREEAVDAHMKQFKKNIQTTQRVRRQAKRES